MESLARLKGVVRLNGSVMAGNASGVNDGACALLLADEATAAKNGLIPRARIVGMATAGVAPRIMGVGPAPATQKVLALTGLTIDQMDVIELNEAFAAQGLAVLRMLGVRDDDLRVNPNGGAIALGRAFALIHVALRIADDWSVCRVFRGSGPSTEGESCRAGLLCRNNRSSFGKFPSQPGRLLSWLLERESSVSAVSWPISGGRLLRPRPLKSKLRLRDGRLRFPSRPTSS